jgi:hypothetical protein
MLIAQFRDGAVEHRGTCGPHTKLLRDLWSEACICRLAHQPNRLSHRRIRDQSEKRGLFELYSEALTDGAVKDRITSGVFEIRQDNSDLIAG